MKLVASLIVRNEVGRYLPLAVEHLLTYCDEVRILDDGSDDGTYEYLGGLQDPVFVKHVVTPSFYVDESSARDALLKWTMVGEPDYVLSIDADEFVADPQRLLIAMADKYPVYALSMTEVWRADEDGLQVRVDGLWGPRPSPMLWKAPDRLDERYGWHIPRRKLACGREPVAVRRASAKVTGIPVYHFGWARESEREQRYSRYVEHDGGRFHRNTHLQSIMWPQDRVALVAEDWPIGLSGIRTRLLGATSNMAVA